jgi:RNA polymerase sigma-70 factor (ECF subfamily)
MADDLNFEAHRDHLLRVAYGALGSVSEAEDVVQDAYLRFERADRDDIRDVRAWLTTVVGRLALDALDSARARREVYVGPWLPEPIVEDDPADRVSLDESVSMALMVLLESLSPAERTAFVLHDIFDVPFEEVAEAVGRTSESVRQLASRARRHVAAGRPRFPASRDEHREIVFAFGAAAVLGDFERLLELLDPDVVWRSDGGGKAQASLVPQHGAKKIAKAMVSLSALGPQEAAMPDVNGAPGVVLRAADGTMTVYAFTINAGRITEIHCIRNPDKLDHLQ